tara:strand:+ start:4194 stop:4763 length:570 start_codon:yes stop_codon:yes gene_type:complete
MVKKNACIFISGSGTNLNALIKSSRNYNFPINISYIISDTKKAKGLRFAKLYKIPYAIVDLNNKLNFELLLKNLKIKNISLICLAGYMKLIKKKFILRFRKKILNIHPSLLPKYKGLNTFYRVLKYKEKITGCTIHYVNEKLDAGKIILQKKVLIEYKSNETELKSKVQNQEYKAYSQAIYKIYSQLNF